MLMMARFVMLYKTAKSEITSGGDWGGGDAGVCGLSLRDALRTARRRTARVRANAVRARVLVKRAARDADMRKDAIDAIMILQ